MTDFDWKSVVKTVAPILGAALGTPLGGAAVAALANALGLDDKTEAGLATAIAGATPEQLLAVKKTEEDFALQMQQLGFANIEALEKIAAADRADARGREVKTGDWTPRLIAALVVVGWVVVQFFLLNNVIDASMRELIARVLGTLDSALMLVLSYYFGSSAGSHAKDATIAAQAGKAAR